MSLFKINEEELISKEEDKDLAKVAVNRAKAKAAANRNTKIGYLLALVILLVASIAHLIPQDITILCRVIFGIVLWALLTVVITVALSFRYSHDVKEEYEKQLFELKVLTKK